MKTMLIALTGLMIATVPGAFADSDALWTIVHGQCVPDQEGAGKPDPCALVDLARGYAVLKDRRGATQYLVIPTQKLTGIESPDLLAPGAPNFWEAAWEARRFVEGKAGRSIPVEDLGMVVNSAHGRSQNQLHIHVDCVLPDVKQAVADHLAAIGPRWGKFDVALSGHHYRAMRLAAADLATHDPFKLLADGDPDAKSDMGRETLAVLGAIFPDGSPGFVMLSDRADLVGMDVASSESLLDHDCAVLKP
jgi:CDP-diacylglycerol pyrophosphatase